MAKKKAVRKKTATKKTAAKRTATKKVARKKAAPKKPAKKKPSKKSTGRKTVSTPKTLKKVSKKKTAKKSRTSKTAKKSNVRKKAPARSKAKTKPKSKSALLGRPRVTGDARLDQFFLKDYEARQVFNFLNVHTIKELESHPPEKIVDLLTAPMLQTVNRIRKALAMNNRCLSGDKKFAKAFQEQIKG